MGDSITEGTVQTHSIKAGNFVKRDDVVAVVETDKVMVDIRAPEDGIIKQYFANEGQTILVGADFFEIETGVSGESKQTSTGSSSSAGKSSEVSKPKEETKEVPKTQAPPKQEPQPPKAESKPAPPKAACTPSSPDKKPPTPKGVPPPPGMQVGKEGLSTITGSRSETRVKMSRMRQTIAKRLKDAQNTNAMLTTFNEIDMSAFMDLRKQFQDSFQKKHGVKLGFMGAFVKGVVQAAKEQPIVNAVIEGDEIIYRDYVDISVAVSTPTGLVVPVLRN